MVKSNSLTYCLLNRLCWLIPLLLWTVLVALSLWHNVDTVQENNRTLAEENARKMFQLIELTRFWNARHGGVYVPVTDEVQPNPYLDVEDRDIETTDGKRLTLINPAYMTRQVAELTTEHDIYFHITSLKPIRPANEPDPWERQALQRFEGGVREVSEFVSSESEDAPRFRYMAPLKVSKPCMQCHAKQGYQVGDIRGGISVTFTGEHYRSADQAEINAIVVRHIGAWLLFSLLGALLFNRLRSQWTQLKDQQARQESLIEERTAELRWANKQLQGENRARAATERALTQSEEQVRLLLNATAEGIYALDTDGTCTVVNGAAAKLLGYAGPDELLGRNMHNLIHHHDEQGEPIAAEQCSVMKVTRNGRGVHEQTLFWRADGSSFPVELRANPIYHEGRLFGTAVSFVDITERKAEQERLSRSEERFRELFDNTSSGVAIYRAINDGEDFEIIGFNRSAERIEGLSRTEVVGKRLTTVFPAVEEFGLLALLREVWRDGTPRRHPVSLYLDGRIEGWRENYIFRLSSGEVVAVYDDVTEEKQLEESLKENEERLKLALEGSNEGLWDWQVQTGDVYYSPRWQTMLGFEVGEVEARIETWERLLHPDDAPKVNSLLHRHLSGEHDEYEAEVRLLTKGGDWLWVMTRGKVVERDAEGRPVRAVGTHTDIDARKKAEEALSRSATEWNYAMDFLEDVIYLLDPQRRLVRANRAFYRMMQTSPKEAIGRHISDIVHPDGEEIPCPVCQAQEDGRDEVITMEADHPNNPSGRPIEVHIRVIRDQRGETSSILVVIHDLSRSRLLEEEKRLAATVFENTAEGVMITDSSNRIVAVNDAFTEITGYKEHEAVGNTPAILKSEHHDDYFYAKLWEVLLKRGRWRGEIWNRRKDGEVYPEWLTISEVRDLRGNITHYVGVFTDISEIKHSQEQLEYLANHDALTGLPNRRLFVDRVEHAIKRAKRDNVKVAVLFVDLDHFKYVNDSFGHPLGDRLLNEVSMRFQRQMREEDTVARLGGDEFIILMEGLNRSSDAAVVAEKVLSTLKQGFTLDDREFFLGASIGISLYPHDGEDAPGLIRNADAAMYQAKDQGRDRYHFYSSELTTRAYERLTLESHLRQAIERDELSLYYQPQVALESGEIIGAEALLRWHQQDLGSVSPALFIPVAEESGLIIEIGSWVLERACVDAKAWLDSGLSLRHIAVNVAGQQLQDPGFVERVQRVLSLTGLPAEKLELEVTESFIMRRAEHAIDTLERLSDMGITISIDDFGTGYSSLSYLKRLPIDRLKIDQSFIRDLSIDPDDAAITRSIVVLGESMQLKVIAEGIETEAQRDFLIKIGCRQGQGYLFARPLPHDEFVGLIKK